MEVGDIFIKENIVFKDANIADHSYKFGRPCLLIAETNEQYYFLTISHKIYHSKCYKLKNNNVKGYINLKNIYKTDTYYYKVIDRLTKKEYLKVIEKLFACQKLLNDDLYEELLAKYDKKERKFLK